MSSPGLPTAPSRFLFASLVFLGSFLLFLIEPIAARQILPVFGGSAAVWITCLVFFQTALLAGYSYAHWLTRRPRWDLHYLLLILATVSAALWCVSRSSLIFGPENPFLSILTALTFSIGLPFLMLAATSPLMQVWLSRIETAGIPYRLFALSNLASLLALVLYPSLIEPHFTFHAQRLGWCFGFVVFALVSGALAWKIRLLVGKSPEAVAEESAASPASTKLLWLLLPMGAAMQLSAVTSHLTANIAAIPLLWIIPLTVYLITLILAFQFPGILPRGITPRLLVVMLASLGYMLAQPKFSLPLRISILFFLVELFAACLFCHTEAYLLRPKRSSETTLFYLLFAAGGALGTFAIGIASPLIFSFNYDLALSFLATAFLALTVTWRNGWAQRLLWSTAAVMLVLLIFRIHSANQWNTPVAVRNFYGSLRVKESYAYPAATQRTLTNGTIQHGSQIFSADLRRTPTTYYAEDSGVGLALRLCCVPRPRNVGVIGLGVGTLAAYGKPQDRMRFYEINPAVQPIAEHLFTYLRDSAAEITLADGDARRSLAREIPQAFDVLVIDAFSSDAVPLHLLTQEAMAIYEKHLAPGGILAFHISNQYVDLEPEIVLLARSRGMNAMTVSSAENVSRGEFFATWVLVSHNAEFFALPEVAKLAHRPHENPKVRLWTDDYSSLLPLIHW